MTHKSDAKFWLASKVVIEDDWFFTRNDANVDKLLCYLNISSVIKNTNLCYRKEL